jgi:hypothetical protein
MRLAFFVVIVWLLAADSMASMASSLLTDLDPSTIRPRSGNLSSLSPMLEYLDRHVAAVQPYVFAAFLASGLIFTADTMPLDMLHLLLMLGLTLVSVLTIVLLSILSTVISARPSIPVNSSDLADRIVNLLLAHVPRHLVAFCDWLTICYLYNSLVLNRRLPAACTCFMVYFCVHHLQRYILSQTT